MKSKIKCYILWGFFFLQLLCKPVCVKGNMMNVISKDFPIFPIYLSLGHTVQLIKHASIYSAFVPFFFRALLPAYLGPKVNEYKGDPICG